MDVKFAQHKPDVIISSLVASIVAGSIIYLQKDPIMMLGLSLELIGSLQSEGEPMVPTDHLKKFPQFYGEVVAPRSKALVLKAYLKGIAESGAQLVYFSDTNVHNFDKIVFEDFKGSYKNNFTIDSLDNAWNYRPGYSVSWYTFGKKELCAFCRAKQPTNTCTGCRTAKYCNVQCQKDHWGMHKNFVQKERVNLRSLLLDAITTDMVTADIYSPGQWRDFFLTVGSGAAALTGLLVVAMSLHIHVIVKDPVLRHRALSILTNLAAIFMRCSLVLMGGQNYQAVGVELFIVCGFAAGIGINSFLEALKLTKPFPKNTFYRTMGNLSCYVAEMLGALILVSGLIIGLYVAAIAMVANFYFVISGSWLLLARVCSDEKTHTH